MSGFIDVLLRGLALVAGALSLGGIVFARAVLAAGPGVKPDPASARALRLAAAGGAIVVATQVAMMTVSLGALAQTHGGWPIGPYLETAFARAAAVRVVLGSLVVTLAVVLARRSAGQVAWIVLGGSGVALVASSAWLSHAMARLDDRGWLVTLDAVHQVAAAIWVGGLIHLTIHALRGRAAPDGGVPRRFSTVAFWSVAALVAAGLALTIAYVGEPSALVGTAYGVMVLTKVVLLGAALGLAAANHRAVRRATTAASARRLGRFVEVEMGLAITVLFAAASLTSLPPAVDVTTDRATLGEVGSRFAPRLPRLVSPPIDELLQRADPLMGTVGARHDVERAWSEYNHHWAGLFVLAMGLLACAERLGVRLARHWPLLFLGLAAFLFVRNDPRAWPLGPAGFWESLTLPDVLQHRMFVVIIVAFGLFEWAVRTGRLPQDPWAKVFPLICAVGGGLLLTHSHAMFALKDEFLTEVTHAPIGVIGAFAGWARWLEVRLPGAGALPGWLWRAALVAVGLLLVFYREG
jgi:putative copper resistance protein D